MEGRSIHCIKMLLGLASATPEVTCRCRQNHDVTF